MDADQKRETNGPAGFATFIVRVLQDDLGRLSGVVERVRTGEKVRFHGVRAISEAIAGMIGQSGTEDDPKM